jgi:hypothetical protein
MSTESNNRRDWLPFEIRILPDDPSVEMLPRSLDNFRPIFNSYNGADAEEAPEGAPANE